MDPSTRKIAATDFLSSLERREAALLAWGLADGSFSEDELDDLAGRFLDERRLWGEFSSPDELIKLIEDLGLLFPFRVHETWRYRTRTAEAIRLFLRLRQLFPKHMAGRGWLAAPTLVADARYLVRPRSYPRWDWTPAEVADKLRAAAAAFTPVQLEAAGALIDGRDLAGFQVRAAASILRGLPAGADPSGTIVCAGTGSGKTLAFYLPALIHLCGNLAPDPWPRCLALYPRNELLKDQFSEAYALARRIDPVLARAQRRNVRIGALFGATPRDARSFETQWPPEGWKRVSGGYVCSLLRCPRPGCRGGMVWADEDRRRGVERLSCSGPGCTIQTGPDELALTREGMLRTPPDILFTTTEMLNQRLGDSRFGRLFGVGTPAGRKPELVLLDEVHTYGGIPGAQAALLLRRWLHASRATPHFVGLSATLRDAKRFFATLVGLPIGAVHEERPAPGELTQVGMEYLLALRGDPGSGASLLSTTIQATMLLRRVLDPADGGPSRGVSGRKLFLFTDALDVTNRLFFDLRDAEGQDSWGNPDPGKPWGSLANLRSPNGPDAAYRFTHGQSWDVCERAAHRLGPGELVRIGRTTSQDAGVDADADVIVATAALEVGFNDPAVGAVLQHKAPMDTAAFLQRKGRAGRDPRMRPWTVVVLSDYGRDRLAYQSYDLLFDPELPARDLPVGNRHVIRMQAVYATMDWLAGQLEGLPAGGVWQDLAQPWDHRSTREQASVRARQERIAAIAEEVLTRPERQGDLARYLQEALRVPAEEIDAVLWDPPRPLLTAVLPTLARRLARQWRKATPSGSGPALEFFEPNAPLPEFVPRALFQDLNLPEVTIVTDPQQQGDRERREALPVARSLTEFAPGRVSRRYGIMHRYARHWVAPPALEGAPEQDLPIGRHHPLIEELGAFQYGEGGQTHEIRCVRSWVLKPEAPPKSVADSSNAVPEWRTQILPEGEGVPAELPRTSPWSEVLAGVRFYSHRHRCPVEVRRFALGSRATIAFEDGTQLETRIRYVAAEDDLTPVAVGFACAADAVALRVRVPDQLHRHLHAIEAADLLRVLRPAMFHHRVRTASELDGVANVFARQWLAQAYLCAASRMAVVEGLDLAGAARRLREQAPGQPLGDVLDVFFQVLPPDLGRDDQDDEATGAGAAAAAAPARPRTHLRLLGLLDDPIVREVLDAASAALWEPPGPAWDAWLTGTFLHTVGAAARDAVQGLCPDVDAKDLLVDPDPGPPPGGGPPPDGVRELWLTESAVGGGGVVEKLQARYAEDPRRLFDLMTRALEPSDFERTDEQLTQLVAMLADEAGGADLRAAVAAVRDARDKTHHDLREAFDRLRAELRGRQILVTHPVVAALNARILRPGSGPALDRTLHALLTRWSEAEARLGIDLDPRTFAWLCADETGLDTVLGSVPGGGSRAWRFGVLYGLFWPRGGAVRGHRLATWNRYVELLPPERELVRRVLRDPTPVVPADAADWPAEVDRHLQTDGVVALLGSVEAVDALRSAVLALAARPVDTGLLLSYARVCEARKDGPAVSVVAEMPEAAP
jgi:hypothetical protein